MFLQVSFAHAQVSFCSIRWSSDQWLGHSLNENLLASSDAYFFYCGDHRFPGYLDIKKDIRNMSSMNHYTSSEPAILKDQPRHRPLTTMRVIRGVVCLIILLSTAFMMIVYWAPVTTLLLRLFSVHYSRKATSFLFATWLSLWPFLFEKINKTKVVFSGETLPMKERVLVFANHRTEVDWMYLWDLALRKGRLGFLKYVLKSSLMKLPIFGWGFHIFEFIAVERNWEIDESIMHEKLSSLKDPHDPLWLVVFPEGTDYTYCSFACLLPLTISTLRIFTIQ